MSTGKSKKIDPLKPSVGLLSKIGSIVVHAEELIQPRNRGMAFDVETIKSLLTDEEIQTWIKAMGPLLPLKRG